MRIPCPCCGPRDLAEFTYGGDATVEWPSIDDLDVERWARAVYDRANPAGPHEEFWQHTGGCRSWLKVRRDTRTHRIDGAELIGPWAAAAPRREDAA